MISITKEEMDILKQLQDIEDEASTIKRTLETVEGEIAGRKKEQLDLERELLQSEEELTSLRSEYRDDEIEVETRNTRLSKSEEYLKTVSSNTEYQLLLREIDDNRKRNEEVETQMLELMEKIEGKEEETKLIRAKLDDVNAQVVADLARIEKESASDRKNLEKMTSKRDATAKTLNPKLYTRFSTIIQRAAGKAIVPVTNATCGGCYMNIPPQMYIEVQRGDNLYFCPQCQRMLYYKEA